MDKRLAIPLLVVSLSLIGAGCSKKTPAPQANQPATTNGITKLSPELTIPKSPKDEVLEAIANFREVKYFKARFSLPLEKGTANGNLSFIKPDRMRIAISATGASPSEMIRVGDTYFIRVGDTPWRDITDTDSAKKSYEAMNQALDGNAGLAAAEGLKVNSKFYDRAKNCDLYNVEFKAQDQKTATVELCVRDSLPLYFKLPSAGGKINLEYYDFDKPFLIEKPL